jgi:hypothetical protein
MSPIQRAATVLDVKAVLRKRESLAGCIVTRKKGNHENYHQNYPSHISDRRVDVLSELDANFSDE